MIEKISLFVAGAVIALLSTWLKSIWDRTSTCSNTLFEMRLNTIDKIWRSFLEVKTIYAQKIFLGHDNWLRTHKKKSLTLLNEYRQMLWENQVLLDHCITDVFLGLADYMTELLFRDDQMPSEYINELNKRLSELSDVINKSMGKRTHTVKLKLQDKKHTSNVEATQ